VGQRFTVAARPRDGHQRAMPAPVMWEFATRTDAFQSVQN
jgi:hypothetical protein